MGFNFFTIMAMLFLASQGKTEESGRLLPANNKTFQPPTPLFSVSGIRSRDSGPAPATHLKIMSPADTVKTPVVASSGNITSKEMINRHDKSAAVLVHSQNSATTLDTSKTLTGAALPIDSVSAVNQNRRDYGIESLFDLRYGILLLSIIVIGFFLRYTLKKANRPTFVTTTRLSIMDKEVQTACRYIEKNYKNPQLSLETVCEALVTGKAFLDALFHQELGLNVEEFIAHVRINRARMLIEKNTALDSDTAARETGFDDTSSFLNAFSSIVGIPFDEYRIVRAKNVA